MDELFSGLLVSCPNEGGLFYIHGGRSIRLDGLDTTGLGHAGEVLLRGLQPDRVHRLDVHADDPAREAAVVPDIHDLMVDGEALYAVATQENAVLELDREGRERRRFVFPGEPDAWHVNCLTKWGGRVLFSAFGDFRGHREYKLAPVGSGFVQDLHSGERVVTGLSQPHSLVVCGDRLLLANSYEGEIREYNAAFSLLRSQPLGGYTRGILVDGDIVYVGLSCSRNRESGISQAVLLALDAADWRELGRLVLPVAEIYDVMKPGAEELPALLALNASLTSQVLTERAAERERALGGEIACLQEQVSVSQARIGAGEALEAQLRAELQAREQAAEEQAARLRAELQAREQAAEEQAARLRAELQAREQAVEEQDTRLRETEQALAAQQSYLDLVHHSLSWRMTAPLRAGKATLLRTGGALRRAGSALAYLYRDRATLHAYAEAARGLGLAGTASRAVQFLRRGGPSPEPADPLPAPPVFDLRNTGGKEVVVLSTPHCRYVAELIIAALARAGIPARALYEMPEGPYDDVPHFVICPQMFERLPGLYVAFQMEQSVSTRWFTPEYLLKLEGSFAIFDYSLANIARLVSMGLHARQFYYMPIDHLPGYDTGAMPVEKEYDVLFYGDIHNERRRRCIAELEKVCRVKVVSDLFGQEMADALRRARIVVNIHYYEGALLETTRLWECLSLGCLMVSERASDMDQHGAMESLVEFVDEGDFKGMAERVRELLADGDALTARARHNAEVLASAFNRFDYYFYRFLLASGNIVFDQFWDLVGSAYPLRTDTLCLNLPEYTERAASFDADNRHGFERFPGLRHSTGWIGCALSYKYMVKLAEKHGIPALTVCEDDVQFPADFDGVWRKVSACLSRNRGKWHIFSGLLTDLHAAAEILDVEQCDGMDFVTTNRLIGMVFNVYDRAVYGLIGAWDERDADVERNTIDRYLEAEDSLRVLTTFPFIVGHKEDLHSTLWGAQNTIYSESIARSGALLQQKIADWRRGQEPK